jgi:hypothetical protein
MLGNGEKFFFYALPKTAILTGTGAAESGKLRFL